MMLKKSPLLISLLVAALTLSSCARHPSNPNDPYEEYNRHAFAMNEKLDKVLFRPVATIYHHLVPRLVQRGLHNAFSNLGEVSTMSNDLLQGKVGYFFHDFWRFFLNSTIGVAGLFDVAKKMGLQPHYEDFAITLAHWTGKKNSPYVVLPLLGPSTMHAVAGTPMEMALSPASYLHLSTKVPLNTIKYINLRSRLLPSDKLVDQAFDPYIFVKNAYMQHRKKLIDASFAKGSDHKQTMDTESSHPLDLTPSRTVPVTSTEGSTNKAIPNEAKF